jgi:RNA polymerase sigma factor (sigma-70 family)
MSRRPFNRVLGYLRRVSAPDAPGDGDLLDRFISQQDQAAFEALLCRHGGLVWAVCRRGLFDDADAEDAFQATFLVLLRKARTLDGSGSLAGWLYAVAQRVVRKAREQAARRAYKEREGAAMRPSEAALPPEPTSLGTELDTELARLPERYRAPLVLCYLEGKTNEQAARELGWPIGSISKRLARGRELLRSRLVRRGSAVTSAALTAALAEAASPGPASALTASTTRVVGAYLAGGPAAGTLPPAALNLAEGVLRSMMLSQFKMMTTVAIALVALATGAGFYLHQAQAARTARPLLAPLPAIEPRGEAAKVEKLPLRFECDSLFPRPDRPLITIGHFDNAAFLARGADKPMSRVRLVGIGAMDLLEARAGAMAHLHLVGPMHNSGEVFGPIVLSRRGDTFTLVVESWTDNGGRRRNIRTHDSYLIELGDLKAGDYKVEVVWHGFFCDKANSENVYRETQKWTGTLAFHVAGKDDAPAKGKRPTLEQNQLKTVEVSKVERVLPFPEFKSNITWK